jgi:hypothetical protein
MAAHFFFFGFFFWLAHCLFTTAHIRIVIPLHPSFLRNPRVPMTSAEFVAKAWKIANARRRASSGGLCSSASAGALFSVAKPATITR